jgi:hypothetical protein
MLWYGPWYSMVQYGTVWYSMVQYGTVWYSMVQYGMAWYSMPCHAMHVCIHARMHVWVQHQSDSYEGCHKSLLDAE